MLSLEEAVASLPEEDWGRPPVLLDAWELTALEPQRSDGMLLGTATHCSQASLVGERVIGLASLAGGHQAPTSQAEDLEALVGEFEALAKIDNRSPREYVADLATGLRQRCNQDSLQQRFVCVLLAVVVGASQVWVWRVGANGVLGGGMRELRFLSRDDRIATYRQRGVWPAPSLGLKQNDLIEAFGPAFGLGAPTGHEVHQLTLSPSDIIVLLNRGSLPRGPWANQPLDVVDLWKLDAAWRHGLPAHGVVLGGAFNVEILGWPYERRRIDLRP